MFNMPYTLYAYHDESAMMKQVVNGTKGTSIVCQAGMRKHKISVTLPLSDFNAV